MLFAHSFSITLSHLMFKCSTYLDPDKPALILILDHIKSTNMWVGFRLDWEGLNARMG